MTDNLNPNYYKFPNGAETIDISQYLSGCGSQAVQYVVRSTRIDKDLKGDPIEDLGKAIWFIEQERSRLVQELEDKADVEAAAEARKEPGRVTAGWLGDTTINVTMTDANEEATRLLLGDYFSEVKYE